METELSSLDARMKCEHDIKSRELQERESSIFQRENELQELQNDLTNTERNLQDNWKETQMQTELEIARNKEWEYRLQQEEARLQDLKDRLTLEEDHCRQEAQANYRLKEDLATQEAELLNARFEAKHELEVTGRDLQDLEQQKQRVCYFLITSPQSPCPLSRS